jgi:quercetin dioxygenase-like cupin family protein
MAGTDPPHKGEKADKPWGYELIWAHTDRYAGKILHIRKGESLSYQYHRIKDETIHLLRGLMELEVGDEKERVRHRLEPGACFRINPGTRHRMTALDDCDVLEASTPELDDLVRVEDRYGRVGPRRD